MRWGWAPSAVPTSSQMRGRGVALVKRLDAEQELTFSDYRKFQTDSRMVPAEKKVTSVSKSNAQGYSLGYYL
jgi:hypothetical protein